MNSNIADLDVAVMVGSPPTVWLAGQVDFQNRQRVSEVFDNLLASGECVVRADLSEISYMDSSGLSALVKCATSALERGGAIELVGVSAQVGRILTTCGAAVFFKSNIADVPVCSEVDLASATDNFWHVSDFQVPARPESATMARGRVAEVLHSLPLGRDESMDILIAVGEALTNAIKHGCGCCPDKQVSIRCVAGPSHLSIDVADPGPGFDPEEVPTPMPGSLVGGGMGIYMMRELMDEVSYAFNGQTSVRLVKNMGVSLQESAQQFETLVEA